MPLTKNQIDEIVSERAEFVGKPQRGFQWSEMGKLNCACLRVTVKNCRRMISPAELFLKSMAQQIPQHHGQAGDGQIGDKTALGDIQGHKAHALQGKKENTE